MSSIAPTVLHSPPHWNYFLLLERDLEETFRFVEPSAEHNNVYSVEFGRIILGAATEIENAFRGLAQALSYPTQPSSINEFFQCVMSRFPLFTTMEMQIPRFSMRLRPWGDWSNQNAPDWWTYGYNKIKHDRLGHPRAPTLIRASMAVAALQVVLLHYYRVKFPGANLAGSRESALIVPVEEDDDWGGASCAWGYRLPGEPPG